MQVEGCTGVPVSRVLNHLSVWAYIKSNRVGCRLILERWCTLSRKTNLRHERLFVLTGKQKNKPEVLFFVN